MRTTVIGSSIIAACFALTLAPTSAHAQSVIKNPNAHPDYRVELEPHGDLIFFRYGGAGYEGYSRAYFGNPEFGAGFRATIEVGDPAFIPKINNTVGITFGIDLTNCRFCNGDDFRIWNPVGLQWNFWFTDKWSAFADLGFMLRNNGFYHHVYADFFGMLGGRYMFTDRVGLTMRIGYPFVSLGVSFMAG